MSRSLTVKVLHRLTRYSGSIAQSFASTLRQRELHDASMASCTRIPTHMTRAELNALYDLASSVPERGLVLEVGSYLGASSCFIAAALAKRDGHLYCVDTWANETMPEGERDTFAEFQRNTRGGASRITMVRKRSDEMTAADFRLPFDLAFIDADHRYPAVKRDFELVRDWLRDGAVLAFHDVSFFEAVSRVVGEVLATGRWQLMGHVDNLVWLRKLDPNGFPNPMADGEHEQ